MSSAKSRAEHAGAAPPRAAMTVAEVSAFIARDFAQVREELGELTVEAADATTTRTRLVVGERPLASSASR